MERFGPLYCFSAMSFEAANRTLGEVFTGSSSECEVICRRILQRHRLARSKVQNEGLKNLYQKLSGEQFYDEDTFSSEFVDTTSVKIGKSIYSEGTFLNRYCINHIYFDSPAYRISQLGNCFVSFTREDK